MSPHFKKHLTKSPMFFIVVLAFFLLWISAGHSTCRNVFPKKSIPKNFVPNNDNVYMSFDDAVRFVKELEISSVQELFNFINSPEKPDDFPSNLKEAYAGQFVSYQDFLISKSSQNKRIKNTSPPSLLKEADRLEEIKHMRIIDHENRTAERIINYEENIFPEEEIF